MKRCHFIIRSRHDQRHPHSHSQRGHTFAIPGHGSQDLPVRHPRQGGQPTKGKKPSSPFDAGCMHAPL